MDARLAVETERCKHTFGTGLDSERAFVHDTAMHRTYVRRRVALVMAALTLAAGLGGRVASALTPTPAGDPRAARAYVVRDGDTLWAIATMLEPETDPRVTVDEIERLNAGLSGPLVTGRRVFVPASG
jgi:LysM domain